MPDFPAVGVAPRITPNNFTISLLASGGDKTSVQFNDLENTVAGAELATLRERIGALSNAAVHQTTFSSLVQVSLARVNPLDESYSSASVKMILSFQDNNLELKNVAIPAPDESYFGSDGITIITPDVGASAGSPAKLLGDAIAQIALVLNGGAGAITAGTFAFLKGYRSQQSRKLPPSRSARPSIEPLATTEPGPEPSA
jgi:hypothetical protein